MSHLISTAEAAQRLRRTKRVVLKLIARGTLPASRDPVGGVAWQINPADLKRPDVRHRPAGGDRRSEAARRKAGG